MGGGELENEAGGLLVCSLGFLPTLLGNRTHLYPVNNLMPLKTSTRLTPLSYPSTGISTLHTTMIRGQVSEDAIILNSLLSLFSLSLC